MTIAKPTSRFQFRLIDLLLLMFLYGALCAFVLPRVFPDEAIRDPGPPYPNIGIKSISNRLLFSGSFGLFAGVAFAVWVAHGFKFSRPVRNAAACIAGLLGGVFAPIYLTSILTTSGPRGWVGEAAAVSACHTYCTAQDIYRKTDYDQDGVLEYATSGTGPLGLGDEKIALIDSLFAREFYGETRPPVPDYGCGYLFRILKGQGPHAAGGKLNYLTVDKANRPHMTEGYALVAAPSVYGGKTVNTFIVNHKGTVFSRDFGTETPEMFKNMTEFDPDPAFWKVAE